MKIWTNTNTLKDFSKNLIFTEDKKEAEIILMGSKSIGINEFPNVRGIFRAGVGRDNVPEVEAESLNIKVCFPSEDTTKIIFEETASFTAHLVLQMLYQDIGNLSEWRKEKRVEISQKTLLILGMGNIGKLVKLKLENILKIETFDVLYNEDDELEGLFSRADCLSIHIPNTAENDSFIDAEKLSWLKDGAKVVNTARGQIFDEVALYQEISRGRIKAAFDVFWVEPYKGILSEFHPSNFLMSPHVASTCQGFLSGCRRDLDNLIKALSDD